MDNYEILGVSKDSSMEEIQDAYEWKLKQIDKEVVNEKNAEAFKKVLHDAYEGLMKNNCDENTIVMTKEEFNRLIMEEEENDYYDDEKSRREIKSKKSKKKRNSRNKKASNDNSRNRREKTDYREYKKESDFPWYLELPLKILALPIIIVLSVILFIFDTINIALWAVTKLLIIGSIAVAAIHGYQIYSGISLIRYDIFAACAAVFIISIILPAILRISPKPLEIINNKLKAFVF